MPDLSCQRLARVGLGQEINPRIKPPAVHDGVLRIAGREEDRDVGQPFLGFPRQLRAAQRARHHHVGEDQIYRYAAIDDDECARRIFRLDHAIAQLGEHRYSDLANFIVILDHKDGFLPSFNLVGGSGDQSILAGHVSWKVELDRRSGAHLGIDFYVSARLLEEAISHCEAQACSFVLRLGREKRLIDPLQDIRRNAGTCVGHRDHHILPRRQILILANILVVEGGVAGLGSQPAFTVHRVAGVDRKVQNRILELIRIDEAIPETASDHRLDLDLPAERATKHLIHAFDQTPGVHHPRFQRLAPCESEQLRGKFRSARNAGQRALDPHLGPGIAGDVLAEQLQVSADHLQQIVEVVGDAACELANRLQLLRTDHRRLCRMESGFSRTAFGDVPRHLGEADEFAFFIPDRVDYDVRPEGSAVPSEPLAFVFPASFPGRGLQAYPIALTRDLARARQWLRDRARGSERVGLVASSGASRLKPEGINVHEKIEATTWFLNGKDDVRSSYYMEDPATSVRVAPSQIAASLQVFVGQSMPLRLRAAAIIRYEVSIDQMVTLHSNA